MSLFYVIITEVPAKYVVSKLRTGHFGAVQISPIREDQHGFHGGWDNGTLSVEALNADSKEYLREECRVRDSQTRLWLRCGIRAKGADDVYEMARAALDEFKGDLAMMINGDEVCLERVNGKLMVDRNEVSEARLKLFTHPYELATLNPPS